MTGLSELSLDFLTGRPAVTALILVLFLLLAIYLYRRTNPPLSRGIRILLMSLRILAVLALFLALFEPVLSYKREFDRPPRLSVLIDNSRSMNFRDNEASRLERIDDFLNSDRFQQFAADFDMARIAFAGNLAGDDSPLDREKTALGESLRELAGRQMGSPAEAWLLFSDGISNSGLSPVEAASKLKTPVYAIGVGRESAEKDVAIGSLDYNRVVFAGRPTSIKLHLEWQGMNNQKAEAKIESGSRELASASLKLPPGQLKDELEIKFVPERPGQQTFRVSIPGLDEELTTDNNSRSFSMTVLKSKLKALLVADHPDWEYAFLHRYLAESESIDPETVIFDRQGGFMTGRFPLDQAELNQYDLVILYDVGMEPLKSRAAMFRSYLNDRGGGLLVLLGENYLQAPFPRWLDEYLPVVNTGGANGRLVHFKYNGLPLENYLFHPAVRIAESRQGIREAWRNLPHFEALVTVDSLCPESELLAVADMGLGPDNPPLLAYRNFRAGKVLAATAAPFWHWAFFGYGFGEDDSQYRRWLGGIINWLSVREEHDPIQLAPEKNIYTRGEKVVFQGSVYDLGFRPINDASGYVTLINEADTTLAQLVEIGEGRYQAAFTLLPPGRYRYRGVIEKDGKRLREVSGEVAVETYSIEEFRRRPDMGTLSKISQLSGGTFYTLDNSDSLFAAISRDPVRLSVAGEISLWNKTWLLILFIAALGLEWLLRKRFQLV